MASHANSTPLSASREGAPQSKRVTARHTESEADAFRRWEAEAFAAEQAAQSLEDEFTAAPWWARQADLETLIIATPAATRAAILVKARLGRIDRQRDIDPVGITLWSAVVDHLAEGDERERQTRFVAEPSNKE